MYEREDIVDSLDNILEGIARIRRRFDAICAPEDFNSSEEGRDRLDGICMMLIAIGEVLKRLDRNTDLQLLQMFPLVDWKGLKGARDVMSHSYFQVDVSQIFDICEKDIPAMAAVINELRIQYEREQ